MATRRHLVFYLITLLGFGLGIVGLLVAGARLEPAASATLGHEQESAAAAAGAVAGSKLPLAGAQGIGATLLENLHHPLAILLLQILVIVLLARLAGRLVARFGQPAVIGEMIAGILLGPSLLGWVAPNVEAFLFPPASLPALRLLSQVGIILFMFVVGLELDIEHLKEKADAAILVSHASILVPFFLGTALALVLYRSLAPRGVPFAAFALFLGVAMSITAFPVLARIIEERGLGKSVLGSTAIACAAVDDVTAWCLLALVVAIAKANALTSGVWTLLLSLAFIALMLFLLRPLAARLLSGDLGDRERRRNLVVGVLAFVFSAALVTETIGIHALFGAFLAGVSLPAEPRLRTFLQERLATFSSAFLLPLFFAYNGLRTQVGLLDDLESWLVCLGIIAVAIAGKLGGSTLAARFTGMSWLDSFSLGALMNTRGLVELIALNLAYDLGILSPRIFAMLVLMALTTTFMAGPLLSWADRMRPRPA